MRRDFVLSGPAQRDIEELLDYVSETSGPSRALHVHQALRAAFQKIADMPDLGHFHDDLTPGRVRFYTVWAYHIIYKPETTPVMIARVLHGARGIRLELQEGIE